MFRIASVRLPIMAWTVSPSTTRVTCPEGGRRRAGPGGAETGRAETEALSTRDL
jgi:hypothetical protein